jgi:hypothetical protein
MTADTAVLVEALAFYANIDNWRHISSRTGKLAPVSFTSPEGHAIAEALSDVGHRAKLALAAYQPAKADPVGETIRRLNSAHEHVTSTPAPQSSGAENACEQEEGA